MQDTSGESEEIRALTERRAASRKLLGRDLYALAERLDDALIVIQESLPAYANPAARVLAARFPIRGAQAGQALSALFPAEAWSKSRISGSWSGEISAPAADGSLVFLQTTMLLLGEPGQGETALCMILRDVSEARHYEEELQDRHSELQQAYVRLAGAQEQLLQSERMASIGQLAAGVAHEINNPIGYVHSNLHALQDYVRNLFTLVSAYESALDRADCGAEIAGEIDSLRQRFDIDFLISDMPSLIAESREGIERVTRIVQDLKDFSHTGRGEEWAMVDLHRGLESTLNIVWNEIKYKARIDRRYGTLPNVECLPSEINQVFMNLLVNAGQAIVKYGHITLASGCDDKEAWISVGDDGAGIDAQALPRIFDPFYTTKPVGKGSGLGLSISYGIVTKHHGRIEVDSETNRGTTFRVVLPLRQPRPD